MAVRSKSRAGSANSPSACRSGRRGVTVSILVVDDESDVAELYRQRFNDRGVADHLQIASSGFATLFTPTDPFRPPRTKTHCGSVENRPPSPPKTTEVVWICWAEAMTPPDDLVSA